MSKIARIILTIVALVAVLGLPGMANAEPVKPVTDTSAQPFWTAKPCKYEDSVNCYWDAQRWGNRKGHSFVARLVPGSARMVCVFFVDKGYAKHHDYCTGNPVAMRKSDAHPDFDGDGFIE